MNDAKMTAKKTRSAKKRFLILLLAGAFLSSFISIAPVSKGLIYPVPEFDYQWQCVQSKDESINVGDRILMNVGSEDGYWQGRDCKVWNVSRWYHDGGMSWTEELKNVDYLAHDDSANFFDAVEEFAWGEIYFVPRDIDLDLVKEFIVKKSIYDNSSVDESKNLLVLRESHDDHEIRLIFDEEGIMLNKNVTISGITFVEWRLLDEEEQPIPPPSDDDKEVARDWSFLIPLLIGTAILLSFLSILLVLRNKKKAKYHYRGERGPSELDGEELVEISLKESHVLAEKDIPRGLMEFIEQKGKPSGVITYHSLPKEYLKSKIFQCEYELKDGEYFLHCFKEHDEKKKRREAEFT